MALNIIKSTDVIKISQVKVLLYAPPGVGKTSTGFTAEKPLCLDFDKGAHRSEFRQDTVIINSWEDVSRLTPDDLAPYSTILIDTVGRCLDFISAHVIEKDYKLGRKDGVPTQQGYGAIKTVFRQWINHLIGLRKDIVMVAHSVRSKDRDDTFFVPEIMGSSYNEVIKIVDFMGYMYKDGGKTILNFNPSESWDGKNSAGFAPLQIPNYHDEPQYLAGKIFEMKAKMGQVSNKAKEAVKTVRTWSDTIATYNTPDDFTLGLRDIQQLEKPLQIQIGAVLKKRREELGIGYDPDKKSFFYVPKEEPKTAPAQKPEPASPVTAPPPAQPVQQAPLSADTMAALREIKNEAPTQTAAPANSPAFPF